MNKVSMNNVYVNPNPQHAVATMEATRMQNEALALERRGEYALAERLYLRAIEIRNQAFGPGNNYVAINQNSLGELYIKMGRLNDAEDQLNKALDVRSKIGPPFDAAVTRENLAQLYEMRGNIEASKEMRMRGSPDQIACGHYQCPATQPFNIKQIRRCGGCKSAMYCSKGCQTSDWKRHKKFCRNPTA